MSKAELAKQIRTGQHIPDILDCLAQLSNDEVPTPPKLARAMLDILPGEVWGKDDYVWLDPVCKSGVFLREAAARLLEGLSDQIPDFDERREHIYKHMLWGTSITEMTGIISRRSLYYSRDASGEHSVFRFDHPDGNIPFVRAEHTFPKKKDGTVTGGCTACGAPLDLERGEGRENHAYSFIHGVYPTKEMQDMKFDVIVGNPPYQVDDGGHGTSATPIYQEFVSTAISLDPRYVVMITPSRWFAGGKGLDTFRDSMLSDSHLAELVDYPKLYDCFPGVKIRGGVSYFLWDREHSGPCRVQTMWDGVPVGPAVSRHLGGYGVLIRRNEAVPILDKVRSLGEATLSSKVSSRKPFGLPTNFHGSPTPEGKNSPIRLYGSQRRSWVSRSELVTNRAWSDDWKVLMTAVQGTSAAVETMFLSRPIVAGPDTACTETYLVAGRFATQGEAESLAAYLRTRFVRFLVSLRKPSQHATKDVYAFVPDVPLDRHWTDAALYERYGICPEEIAFIESQVNEMPAPEKEPLT
ncbi:Eco57I restriction-modification methylase domain-containing protein [Janibacter indicus]|uniref:Site-specific DNA-methyltransferase (Adenine-specific) n=1 Tax=Janibacter indicus TaxID=857417 RepID=A0A1W2AQK5_9MICO|nr:Eco57I restriction-modification methylase domain-containing protein [Janibacter indicus]SMC62731.1 site-specific DNA-methyltransferase (adenine-specific) [Janibacter indicus]